MKNIERGEARISRKDDIMKAIGKKLYHYKNPWHELKIQYGQIKGKLYNEDAIVSCLDNLTPSKLSVARQTAESPPSSMKKRK
ncbi:ISWI chromatin-remodeling complex ATPase chr11 [Orobanche hederae]